MLHSFESFCASMVYKEQDMLRVVRCRARKKWVAASPEEQVRQYCLYVLNQQNYPLTSMAVEKSFTYLTRKKRADILVYDLKGEPFLLVECKRHDVLLQESDLMQLFSYNAYWHLPYIAIYNGHKCYTLVLRKKKQVIESMFPVFPRSV